MALFGRHGKKLDLTLWAIHKCGFFCISLTPDNDEMYSNYYHLIKFVMRQRDIDDWLLILLFLYPTTIDIVYYY